MAIIYFDSLLIILLSAINVTVNTVQKRGIATYCIRINAISLNSQSIVLFCPFKVSSYVTKESSILKMDRRVIRILL